jgi:hypothetical protein
MRGLRVVSAVAALVATMALSPPAAVAQKPAIYVQYHIWYDRGACPAANPRAAWLHWAWWSSQDNPCTTTAELPWLRNITSISYPLIGPYASADPSVLRWHIRLAKAAGIDAFLVSVFPAVEPEFWDRFDLMLRIAHQEKFKLGLEAWSPPTLSLVAAWQSETRRYLEYFPQRSPYRSAILRMDGRPVLWFNFAGRTQGLAETAAFLNSVEAFWIFSGSMSLEEERALNALLTRASAAREVTYNFPTERGWDVNPILGRELADRRAAGLRTVTQGFPGYDEQLINNEPGRINRYGLRQGGQALRNYLQAARDAGADAAIISSWNEWNETTQLEPGVDALPRTRIFREPIYGADPYGPLKVIAEHQGRVWRTPALPCRILDALLIAHRVHRCRP